MRGRSPLEEGRRRRLIGWAVFYAVLLVCFAFAFWRQSHRIDTNQLPSGHILLTTSKDSYTVGDTVKYTIFNQLNSPLSLSNKCPAEPLNVYKWQNNAWARIHAKSDAACKSGQLAIRPGKSYSGSYSGWPKLFDAPGIYRIVMMVGNYNGLAYADFDVTAKPTANTPAPPPQIIYKNVYTPVYIQVPGQGGDD